MRNVDGSDQRSVIDTYREQLRPYIDGVGQFDALVVRWLISESDELRDTLLKRSDSGDRNRVNAFFSTVKSASASADLPAPRRRAPDQLADSPATLQVPPKETLTAADLADPPETLRQLVSVYRILRDTQIARELKVLHQGRCQLCGNTIELADGTCYSEAHHIRPLGAPHFGPDRKSNMLVLCPNDHARCDLGAITLDLATIRTHAQHDVGGEFLDYHNREIHAPRFSGPGVAH